MITIAVAGGTGKLGLTIAETLLQNKDYSVIVLSREARELPVHGLQLFVVDYGHVDGLRQILETNQVHTIVSALQVNSPESGTAEINLVKAADQSLVTKRFISSDWAMPINDPKLQLPYLSIRRQTVEKLRSTNLEWTTIYNGMVMDHLGTPRIKSRMGVYGIHVDMANRAAAIPGTGEDLVGFTYSIDIAHFVEAVLSLEKWPEELYCYSDNRTYNEVIRIAESTVGSKFAVTYDPPDKLERGEMTELPIHRVTYARMPKEALQRRFSMFGLYIVNGLMSVPPEQILNQIFPDIKTHKVEDVMAPWKEVS